MQTVAAERIATAFENGDKVYPLSAVGALEMAPTVLEQTVQGQMVLTELWAEPILRPEGTPEEVIRFENAVATAIGEHFEAGQDVSEDLVRGGVVRALGIRRAYTAALLIGAITGQKLGAPVSLDPEGETASAFRRAQSELANDADAQERARNLLGIAFSATTSPEGVALSFEYKRALGGEASERFPVTDRNSARISLMTHVRPLLEQAFTQAGVDLETDQYASALIHNFFARPSEELIAR